ncbi:hypothetical protein [Paraburkholderia hospita]|jgi:hypothetical protein|uniref:hypothetical protein n=1 Tax=Paraburkholderia hospita TaxID=169430 RepID=UPI000DEEB910|nr:hypothetical protein [Paraburkholderia hospita]AXF01713.1 hypothetical protein CUJ88_25120 [Paraburkholderia hospita]
MYIEFQYSTEAFARILRNHLKEQDFCKLCGLDDQGSVTDRIVVRETADATLIQREKLKGGEPAATLNAWFFSPHNYYSSVVPYLQVVQQFDLFLVTADDLEKNGVNPSPANAFPIKVALNIELRALNQTQGGGPAILTYRYAWIDLGFLEFGISPARRAALEASLAALSLPPANIDLSALEGLAGNRMHAINAGIALCDGGTSVVMRIDTDVTGTPPALSPQFFTQGAPNILAGQEWVVLIDKAILVEALRAKLAGQLTKNTTSTKLKWGPEVVWDANAPTATATAGVEALAACPFFVDDIDLDVEVIATVTFSLQSATEIVVGLHLMALPSNEVEVVGCLLVQALVWPILGPIILDKEKSDSIVGDYIAGMTIGIIALCSPFVAGVNAKALEELDPAALGAHCEKTGDADVRCTYPLYVNVGSSAFPIRLRGVEVRSSASGLIVCGSLDVTEVPAETITVTTSDLEWTLAGDCRNGFRFVDQAQIRVTSSGRRGGLCDARALDDPFGEFAVTVDQVEDMVTVSPRGLPDYANPPERYPCKVRVMTSGGVRTVSYPPPEAMTAERRKELEQMRHNFNRVCQAWKDTFVEVPWGGWGPPGPIDGPDWLQQWELAIHELEPGEWLDVETNTGARVLSAMASPKGVVHFGALFERRDEVGALRISRRGAGPFATTPVLTTALTVLSHSLTMQTEGWVSAMYFEGPDIDRRLTVVDNARTRILAVGGRTPGALLNAIASPSRVARSVNRLQLTRQFHPALSARAEAALRHIESREGNVLSFTEPRVGGIAKPLFVRTRDSAVLYEVNEGEPRAVQIYATDPWFENRTLAGPWVARWSTGDSSVQLYRAVERRKNVQLDATASVPGASRE